MGLRRAVLITFGALTAASWMLLALGAAPWLMPVFLTVHGFTVAAENVLLPLAVAACFGPRHLPAIYGALMLALLPGGTIGPAISGTDDPAPSSPSDPSPRPTGDHTDHH